MKNKIEYRPLDHRKMLLLFLVLNFLYSCNLMSHQNGYGMPRFHENCFSLKAKMGEEKKIERFIDFNCTYKLASVSNITFNKDLADFKQVYLKFYKDGKVAIFDSENVLELNPRRAIMGVYAYENDQLFYEYFSYSKQAGYFRTKQELWIKDGALVERGEDYVSTYTKQPLSNIDLIQPDW